MTATPDLSTSYLGLDLRNPLVASASPYTGRLDRLRQLEDAGVAAVVLPSLFAEEVEDEANFLDDLAAYTAGFPEFTSSPLPSTPMAETGSLRHIALLRKAKAALSIPIIASVNATDKGSWEYYARAMADSGADAIELNLYSVAADPTVAATELEKRHCEVIAAVKNVISVPLTVKLSPYYSSLSNFAAHAVAAGADGLVLFNRFYAPDIDLGNLKVTPTVELSTSVELRLPLRWLGILRGQLPTTSLGCTSGVHSAADVTKALLVGADVVCTTSAVLRQGPAHARTMLDGLASWLSNHGYDSVSQLRGSMSATAVGNPAAFERSQYYEVLSAQRDRF